jgi:EAL domain-containing protein (putative c-di-GMP-specific phosphodiesterase class I)
VDLTNGRIIGTEALLRWNHPDKGLQGPDTFIPVAEESGLIVPIGEWVIQNALAQTKAWQDRGCNGISVAINISARQFQHPQLKEQILDGLDSSGISPECVDIELTESILQDPRSAKTLQALKNAGIRITLDDFGTGFSCLNYLKRFPVDALKIDRSFVNGSTTNPTDSAIVRTIIALAHNLGMKVVAEGVETLEQVEFLRGHDCDIAQGYFFAAALEPQAAGALLTATPARPSRPSPDPAPLWPRHEWELPPRPPNAVKKPASQG